MADVASKDPATQQVAPRKGRWLPIAIGAVAAGVLSGVAYFGTEFLRDSAYEDDRAFRVLGHIVGQFGNLQEAIAGSLRAIPPKTYSLNESDSKDAIKEYERSLALRNVKLTLDRKVKLTDDKIEPTDNKDGKTCAPKPDTGAFDVDTDTSERRFSMCQIPDPKSATPVALTLSGPLADQVPAFIVQDLFDSVVITTHDGIRLATIPRGEDRGYQVQLHDVAAVDVLGGGGAGLLRRAAERGAASGADGDKNQSAGAGNKEPPKEGSAGPAPAYATVFNEQIAGRQYRVFVLPFIPAYATVADKNTEPHLYIIALKQREVVGALNDALGSGGVLVVTLSVLLGILAWPLFSLRFKSPQETIAPTELFAVLISLLLLPAVVATAGFSLWTQIRLTLWADQHAEHYARRVEQTLVEELDSGVHVLDSVAGQFAREFQKELADTNREESLELDKTGNEICIKGPPTCTSRLQLDWHPALRDWSPIRSAVPVNRYGKSQGLMTYFFSEAPNRETDVSDREYFKVIMQHDEWQPAELWVPSPDSTNAQHRYVAQRLFNRTDAARALQIAVPIDDSDGTRLGMVTGDSRAYGLTQTLRVPLLRFAVFDSRNGAVLFHSLDRLSLAENILIEAEHNSALATAMQRRATTWSQRRTASEDHFAGRYQGAGHRFLYRSVPGAPWGIVVFYPTDAINDIVLQTAVATLAYYFALVSVAILVLAFLVLALPERADLAALRWLWPKWQSRDRYPRVAYVITQILLATGAALISRLYRLDWGFTLAAVVSVVALHLAIFRTPFRHQPEQAAPSLTAYKQSYIRCVFGVLMLLSALPAVLIGIDYHDTSVRAVIRDELEDAALDEQQRRYALLRDLQRFNRDQDRPWNKATAGSWVAELSRNLPVPGYTFMAINGDRMRTATWLLTDNAPDPWLRECGPPVLGTVRSAIWSLSTARQVQRAFGPRTSESGDTPRNCRTPIAVRARLPGDDTVASVTTMPLTSSLTSDQLAKAGFASVSDCSQRQRDSDASRSDGDRTGNRATICRDSDLYFKYATGSGFAFVAITIVCVVFITLMSAVAARRLFGIRIPFVGRFTPSAADPEDASQLLDAELELLQLRKTNPFAMTSKDEADWRAVRCQPIYERMWAALATDEQLLLHQLAAGQFANPENQAVIERLLRRGYLMLAPWPRIVEPGFAEFIRKVQPDEMLGKLKYETTHTLWSQLRTPLLVVVVIVAGLLMWLAGSAMHILAGTLAGVAALFGSVAQVTNFIHRDKPPQSK